MPHIRPHNADILGGILKYPEFEWLLTDPGLPPDHSGFGDPAAHHHAKRRHSTQRHHSSRRLVAWLEAHDPLFAATIDMLFDVTDSWPPKLGRTFWKTVNGEAFRFLEIYLEVRDIVDIIIEERAGRR